MSPTLDWVHLSQCRNSGRDVALDRHQRFTHLLETSDALHELHGVLFHINILGLLLQDV